MNIIYIAYSCSPFNGSEDKIGWSIPFESAKTNQVFVVTKEEQRSSIEKYLECNTVGNMHFYYVDIPAFCKKLFSGPLYSGRLNIWNRRAISVVRSICKRRRIDIIHQITPVEFRSIGDYGKFPGVKFVCGPIAGGQMIPEGVKNYTKAHAWVENIRKCVNAWYRFVYSCNGRLKRCDYLLFANYETRDYLRGQLPSQTRCHVLTDISIDKTDLADPLPQEDKPAGKCVILVVGRLAYLKGHALLLDALARIPEELEFECRIVGAGAEMKRLQKRCEEYGLGQKVTFAGEVPYTEIAGVYQKADVFVMPSFREATGSVLLEAMAKGLPVVTINRFGGATMLDETAGWLYDGQTQEEFVENLKRALIFCITHPEEVKRRGRNARALAEKYTWEERMKLYQTIYQSLTDAAH